MNQDISTMATIIAAQNAGNGPAVYYVNALPGYTLALVVLCLFLLLVCVVYGIIKFFTDNKGE